MKIEALLVLAGLALATPARRNYSLDLADEYFIDFINTYDKHYADEAEKMKRYEIFKKNLELINLKNSESDIPSLGINKFSDLTNEEFINTYTGYNGNVLRDGSQCSPGSSDAATPPDSWDWKERGVVSGAKNQGRCGSCWAFSAIGNIESQYARKHGSILDLSEQQLVDCDKASNGCNGTLNMENPFLYLMGNSGSMQEQDYPYQDAQGDCKFDASKVMATVTDCIAYQPQSEDDLKNILHKAGPLTLGVDARGMQGYTDAVLQSCPYIALNHAVLLVGYGTENDQPYWLIKNSWGENYGENGFVKIQRGVNACGLMNSPTMVQAVVS